MNYIFHRAGHHHERFVLKAGGGEDLRERERGTWIEEDEQTARGLKEREREREREREKDGLYLAVNRSIKLNRSN